MGVLLCVVFLSCRLVHSQRVSVPQLAENVRTNIQEFLKVPNAIATWVDRNQINQLSRRVPTISEAFIYPVLRFIFFTNFTTQLRESTT